MSDSKVDFDEVRKLATEVRRAQSSLDAGVQGFANAPSPQPSPPSQTSVIAGSPKTWTFPADTTFGNTNAGAACLSAHSQARSTMDAALRAFAKTADSDAERLESALALYRKTDADSADNILAANRNRLDVLTSHLTLNTDGHAQDQAAQVNRLRGLAGDVSQGNTVVSGDFNTESTGNSGSAQGIRAFGGQGFDVHGGDINDGKGGTSASHRRIDHLMPRGVGASEATRWDRDQSDHDGQVVDLTMPNW